MIEILIISVACALTIVTKNECDMIKHSKKDRTLFPNWSWYVESSYLKRTWWTKWFASFLSDGWHSLDSIRNFSFGVLLSIALAYKYDVSNWSFNVSFWFVDVDVNYFYPIVTMGFYMVLGAYHNYRSKGRFF